VRWVVADDNLFVVNPEEQLSVLWLLEVVQEPLIVLSLPHLGRVELLQLFFDLVHHPHQTYLLRKKGYYSVKTLRGADL